jgi:hypothetical protein
VAGADRAAVLVVAQGVAELAEQLLQLLPAAVHVADDVERALLVAQVVEQPAAGDPSGCDLVGRAQHVHPAEALAGQPAQPAAQLVALAAQHVRAELPVRSGGVAVGAHPLRQVEHDRDGQHVVRAGQLDQLAAVVRLHVRGVDDGQPAGGQPLAHDVVQQLERLRGGGLVVLVVGDHPAAGVAGDHLGGPEVGAAERRLARPADPDEHHQAQRRHGDLPARRLDRCGRRRGAHAVLSRRLRRGPFGER